jgi:hypothetical protein
LRRDLFPRIVAAYDAWRGGDRGRALSAAVAAGAVHWRNVCVRTLALHETLGGDAEREIEALSTSGGSRL